MNIHRIQRVSKLTGLSRDVIRVWERRYGLLRPVRGQNRYRLYTDEDVSLLKYVRAELDKGESIGELAALGREELLARMHASREALEITGSPYERLLAELLGTLEPLDRVTFERKLNGAVVVIPFEEALHGILLPLQRRVGELWHDSRVTAAIEHYVTRQVQQKIFSVMNQMPVAEDGPKIVIACPPGEYHEVGAQAVAYRCRLRGCRVYYLGANVPITDLVKLCVEVRPALTVLSFPVQLPASEVDAVATQLAREVRPFSEIAAGGTGALAERKILEKEGMHVLEDFAKLDEFLSFIPARGAGHHRK